MAATTPSLGQTPWQQRRSVRATYVLILLVLAGCAFTDSFVALAELARATGALPGARAVTLPLMLDGLTLAGTLFAVTRFGPGQGNPGYGYALIAIGSLASLAGNVTHAPDTLAARVIAGAPPLILFLVFEAAAISFRRRPTEPATTTASAAGRSGGEPDPGVEDPEPIAARSRAERIYAEHTTAGRDLTGAQLARLAGISDRYSRTLLAEFRTQSDHATRQPAQANGQPEPSDPRSALRTVAPAESDDER